MAFIIPTKIFKAVRDFNLIDPKLDTPEKEKKLILEAFKKFDLDGSGALDVIEFQQLARKLGFFLSIEEATDYVNEIDLDGNGNLISQSSKKKYLTNKKQGLVDFDEFYAWFTGETDQLNEHGKDKRRELMIKLHKELRNYSVNRWINVVLEGGRVNPRSDELHHLTSHETKRDHVGRIFDEFDTDGNGTLDPKEFRNMAGRFGVELTKKESRAEFDKVDTDKNGQLDFNEFYEWWTDDRKKKDGFYDRIRQGVNEDEGLRNSGFSRGDYKKSFDGGSRMGSRMGSRAGSPRMSFENVNAISDFEPKLPRKDGLIGRKENDLLRSLSASPSVQLIDYIDSLIQFQYNQSSRDISKFKYGLEAELEELKNKIIFNQNGLVYKQQQERTLQQENKIRKSMEKRQKKGKKNDSEQDALEEAVQDFSDSSENSDEKKPVEELKVEEEPKKKKKKTAKTDDKKELI